jgi:hypothetical protein
MTQTQLAAFVYDCDCAMIQKIAISPPSSQGNRFSSPGQLQIEPTARILVISLLQSRIPI